MQNPAHDPRQRGVPTPLDHVSSTADASTAAAVPPRRKARWGRRLLLGFSALLVLLVAFVAAAPWLLSMRAARDPVLSRVNTYLRGNVGADEWNLSWTGPVTVRGLSLRDSDNRELLRVKNISLPGGLWRLVTAGLDFGTVTVEDGRVVVQIMDDNSVSLAKVFESGSQDAQVVEVAADSKLPEPRGTVVLKNIAVEVVQPDGRTLEFSDVDAKLEAQTLDVLKGDMQIVLKDGGKLSGAIDVHNLITDGKLAPENGKGTIKLSTPEAIAVGPLALFGAARQGLQGTAALNVDATFDGTEVQADIAADLKGVLDKQLADTDAAPINVALKSNVQYTGEKIVARGDVTSTAGTMHADGHYGLQTKDGRIDAGTLLGAILTGESVNLPEFDLKADGEIDLVALERAIPGVIKIKPDQKLTGGKVKLSDLVATGGAAPAASGSIQISELASQGGGQSIRLEPVSCKFDAAVKPGAGLEVKAAELIASFARVQASGASPNLKAKFDANLTKLKQELGQIFDLGQFDVAGELTGTLAVARASDERVDVKLDTSGTQVRYTAGDRRIEMPTVTLKETGFVTMRDDKPQRFTSSETVFNLAGQLEGTATGHYDLETRGYSTAFHVKRAELAFLHTQLKGLGVSALERYGGSLSVTGKVEQASGDAPILSDGSLIAQSLTVDGNPLELRDAKATWAGAQWDLNTTNLQLASAKLESSIANLVASDVRFATGDKPGFSGKLDANADIGGVLRAVQPIAKMEKPPEIAGRFTFNGSGATQGDLVTISGTGGIEQLVAGSGEGAVKEDKVTFETNVAVDQRTESIKLSALKLSSGTLSASMTGTVDQYSGPARLALKGRYDTNWDQLTKFIQQFAPSVATTVVVRGATGSDFQISGVANDAQAHPTFRGLSASGFDIAWSEANVYGVKAGPAKFSPSLKDGQLTLSPTSIAAGDGKLNLRGVMDFQPAEPTLKIDGALAVLENFGITNELAHDVLSHINPIFLNVLQIEGKANLDVKDILVPLGESMKRSGSGTGRLDLKTVKMQPAGLIGELVRLGGMADQQLYSVRFSEVDFVIKDGRLSYDNFTMTFPVAGGGAVSGGAVGGPVAGGSSANDGSADFDLKFYGSVGFDDTLDLVVSIPVRPALLEKLGVKGIPPAYAQSLKNTRIDLPLSGTREKPQLDFSKVNTTKLMAGAAAGLVPGLPTSLPTALPSSPQEAQRAVDDVLKGAGGLVPGLKPPGAKPENPQQGKPPQEKPGQEKAPPRVPRLPNPFEKPERKPAPRSQ